jgi:NAD(P)-dependent dehydrogenase (short-subunit alcohol dehydrogenase family)
MKEKVIIVTGANSGIGKEITRELARMGTTVVMAVRNRDKGEKALNEITNETGNQNISLMICDISLGKSIKRFANNFKDSYVKLDVLINNAGCVYSKRQTTTEGYDKSFATNYLGPFQLTRELLQLLKHSAPSRIINVSSGIHKTGTIKFDDLQRKKSYRGMLAYADSKLMLTTYTYELAKRLKNTGVTANVVEPGFVATNLGKNSGSLINTIMFTLIRPIQIPAPEGAKTPVWAATAKELERVTGKCFAKKMEITTAKISYDENIQRSLWETTEELLRQNNI